MQLYHYTAREYLPRIAASGLSKGEVAVSPTWLLNGVWLTTDPNSAGHGLTDGRELTAVEKVMMGIQPRERARFPDKRAVRFTVEMDATSPLLVEWPVWAAGRVEHDWYCAMNSAGGNNADTWLIYWGRIPLEWISEAYDLRADIVMSDAWRTPVGCDGTTT